MANGINYMGQDLNNLPKQQPPAVPGGFDPQLLALMSQLLAPQQQQQQRGPDLGALLAQLRNDPQHDANVAYRPGTDGPANPFSNGFFNDTAANMSPEARLASQGGSAATQWAQRGATPGVDPSALNDLLAQKAPGAMGTAVESVDQYSDPKFLPRLQQKFFGGPKSMPQQPLMPLGNGSFEGMIDPTRQQGKFGDANFFNIVPGQTSLPEGVTMGDGVTNYVRQQQGSEGDTGLGGLLGPSGASPMATPKPMTKKKKPTPFGASASPLSGFSFGTKR